MEGYLNTSFHWASLSRDDDLSIFITDGWINVPLLQGIAEEELENYNNQRCNRQVKGEQSYLVNNAVDELHISMQILDDELKVFSFHRDYFGALRAAGYACIPAQKPHIAMQHILQKVGPAQLKDRMKSPILLRRDDIFDTEKFSRFMRELVNQARKLGKENTFLFDSAERRKRKSNKRDRTAETAKAA